MSDGNFMQCVHSALDHDKKLKEVVEKIASSANTTKAEVVRVGLWQYVSEPSRWAKIYPTITPIQTTRPTVAETAPARVYKAPPDLADSDLLSSHKFVKKQIKELTIRLQEISEEVMKRLGGDD